MSKNIGPTLLQKSKVVPNNPNDRDLVRKLDDTVAIDWIVERIRYLLSQTPVDALRHRVMVVKAQTGSGKSTVMPAEIYKRFLHNAGHQSIVVTQPRVLTAQSIAKDVAVINASFLKLGENIGWSTGPSKRQGRYGLTYATIGSLMQQLRTLTDSQIMEKYRFIIVDEVHEMTIDLAILIYMLKNLMLRNRGDPKVPFLILTSATFDHELFLRYFQCDDAANHQPNYINVLGSVYARNRHWETVEHGLPNYLEKLCETALKIHTSGKDDPPARADVLCFLPGKKEIEDAAKCLEEANAKLAKDGSPVFKVSVLMGEVVNENLRDFQELNLPADQLAVEIKGKKYTPARKIILATNVAETGITINMLKYCIDSGFYKSAEYNPNHELSVLVTRPVSKFRVEQRVGRVGRKFDGDFYPLYPKYIYDLLPDKSLSDVSVGDISPYVLSVIAEQTPQLHEVVDIPTGTPLDRELDRDYGTVQVGKIDLVDLPPNDTLLACWEKLYGLGFIRPKVVDGRPAWTLTRLGALGTRFLHLKPEHLRMILAGYFWEYNVGDLITISAYLTTVEAGAFDAGINKIDWLRVYKDGLPSYLFRDVRDEALYLYKTRLTLCDDFIDGLILYHAATGIIKDAAPEDIMDRLSQWCDEVHVSMPRLMSFLTTRDDVITQMIAAGLSPYAYKEASLLYCDENDFMNTVTRIKYCIYEGFRLSILTWQPDANVYLSPLGIKVEIPSLFSDSEKNRKKYEQFGLSVAVRPRAIMCSGLALKFNEKARNYKVKAGKISACDGYITPDNHFTG